MAFDAHKNFAYSTIAVAPSPSTTGPSVTVHTGDGGHFPAPPFNAVIWPALQLPLSGNAEIVRVTAVASDTFTIARGQEGTAARQVMTGDQIAAAITTKTLTDIEAVAAGALQAANNLSDLASAATARANLGLGSAATQPSTAFDTAGAAAAAQAAAQAASTPMLVVAAPVTVGAPLTADRHTPVDATAGAITMTLPAGQPAGSLIVAEKADATTNLVTLSGNIRGVASSSLTLALQRESIAFLADSAGSWWPVAGHKTLGSLDARYLGAGPTVVPAGNLGAAYTLALPARDVLLIGTLTANATVTVSGLAVGSHFRLLVTQDATGGRTLTLSDGTNTLALTINTAAGTDTVVDCWSPNGTDIVVAGG